MFLSIIVGLVLAYYYFIDRDFSKNSTNIVRHLYHDNFDLTTSYIGNSTWEYTITGSLPNPCYSIFIDPVVMERYPEQVIIKVSISDNSNPDLACIQVIEEVERSGTFNASKEAIISLEVIQ
jgi:hypothetical protein